MCVYVSEVLIGYAFFGHIYMLKTQHLLQRFLSSGASFSKYTEDANPAGSKTQGVNVRLKIFKDVSWRRHTISEAQNWMSLWQHMFLPSPPPHFSWKLTLVFITRGRGCVLALRHTRSPEYKGSRGDKWWGSLTNGFTIAYTCCCFCLSGCTAKYC